MALRICIADDHRLMLDGVRNALRAAEDIEVVGMTQSGAEVLALVERELPDLVLLDYRLPEIDGVTCLRMILERLPQTKVVMLSASEDAEQISEALAAGASAYISKRIDPHELASVVRQVVAGVVYQRSPLIGVDHHLGAPPPPPASPALPTLTEREHTMLEAISRGLSTKAISREFWISETTVKFHLTNVYRKIGARNRTAAMRYAYANGLLPLPAADGDVSAC
jgi:DNA-binding NarL/FixJ family response regulator